MKSIKQTQRRARRAAVVSLPAPSAPSPPTQEKHTGCEPVLLGPGEKLTPAQETALREWIDRVIVPCLVKRWARRKAAARAEARPAAVESPVSPFPSGGSVLI